MGKLPTRPQSGKNAVHELTRAINEIISYLPSLNITGDNKTISVSEHGYGKTISQIKTSTNSYSGGTSTPTSGAVANWTYAKVISSVGGVLVCDLYENGINASATQTNVPVSLLSIAGDSKIATDTYILVFSDVTGLYGGND